MYKITIVKVERLTVVKRQYEKIADTGNPRDNGALYGYVESPGTELRETTMLEQTVEELDLTNVIKAVNSIL